MGHQRKIYYSFTVDALWHGGLTNSQNNNIEFERIQKRIILPDVDYIEALIIQAST